MGVNDLIDHPSYGWDCAKPLLDIIKSAWHPVSEPPTEDEGTVIVYKDNGAFFVSTVGGIRQYYREGGSEKWAYISDVVLLPEE